MAGFPTTWGTSSLAGSLAQNVDAILFDKNAPLRDEFNRLFDSVFTNPEAIKRIVRLLYRRNAGLTRREIVDGLGISDSERLSRNLNALIASDFVVKYVPFGMGKRKSHYKLVDPFCLFYLHFLDGGTRVGPHFWQQGTTSQPLVVWRGIAFENVRFAHVGQIKRALGISGVVTETSAWSKRGDGGEGAQIDLLILRADNVVNMCEIKYYGGRFAVDKGYYQALLERQALLAGVVSPKVSIHSTLITTFGLRQNRYGGAFASVVTLDDLFA